MSNVLKVLNDDFQSRGYTSTIADLRYEVEHCSGYSDDDTTKMVVVEASSGKYAVAIFVVDDKIVAKEYGGPSRREAAASFLGQAEIADPFGFGKLIDLIISNMTNRSSVGITNVLGNAK